MELTVKNVRARIVELRDKLNTLDGKGGPEGGAEGGKGGKGRGGGGAEGAEGGEGGEGKGEAGQDDGAEGGAGGVVGAIASLGGAAAMKVRMDRLKRQTILLEQLKASVKAQGSALSSAGLAWGNDVP